MRRLEYTVIGDAVNVAGRLCAEAAPGEILVSEDFLSAGHSSRRIRVPASAGAQGQESGGAGVSGDREAEREPGRGSTRALSSRVWSHPPRDSPRPEHVALPASSISSSTSRSGRPITLKKSPSIRSTSAAP